jgi:uncharacterized oligopeptide transporter (OPT) family protein
MRHCMLKQISWNVLAMVSREKDEKHTIPVSSGLIAGETLMGVAIKLCIAAPELVHKLLHSATK